MIPQISQAPGVVQLVLNFCKSWSNKVYRRYGDKLCRSSDNVDRQQYLPTSPRCGGISAFNRRCGADRPSCRAGTLFIADLYPRGGGTGTNGQALNQGIIVDMSRHMNRIIEINPEEGWVRVEAGVIKDQLNQYLKPFGYFLRRNFRPATGQRSVG